MVFAAIFQPFVEENPVHVMFRGTRKHICRAERIERLCAATAVHQHAGEWLFSTCAGLLSLVGLSARQSVHAAYWARREPRAVAVQSVYDSLEPRQSAVDADAR